MQTAYRCKHCKYVHVGKVSSCDCQTSTKFEYTLVQIIDVPENEEQVPQFKDLKHSRAPRYVNVKGGHYGNGINEVREKRADGSVVWTNLGTMQSGYDSTDMPYKFCEDNRKANVVLAAAGPVMLEALYMCYQYFSRRRLVRPDNARNMMRLNIIAEAIKEATDISVFDTIQYPKE